jgi:AraC-like DNA-binding protein
MKAYDVDAINKIDLGARGDLILPLWIKAAEGDHGDSLTYKDHSHTFSELHIMLAGSIGYGIGDKQITLLSGEGLLVTEGVLHRVNEVSENFFKVTVAFCASRRYTLPKDADGRPFLFGAIGEKTLSLIDNIMDVTRMRGEFSREITRSYLIQTVYSALSDLGARGRREASPDTRVFMAKKYIDDNPQIFFTCEEIAAYCRLSSKHLGRLFLEEEGVTLLEYIHKQKLASATEMIEKTALSYAEISRRLGFGGAQYFGKFILKYTGKTPGEYRLFAKGDSEENI